MSKMQYVISDDYPRFVEDLFKFISQQNTELDSLYDKTGDIARKEQNSNRFNEFKEWFENRKELCDKAVVFQRLTDQNKIIDILAENMDIGEYGNGREPVKDAESLGIGIKNYQDKALSIIDTKKREMLAVMKHLYGHAAETPDTVICPEGYNYDINKILQLLDQIVVAANIPLDLEVEAEQMKQAQQAQEEDLTDSSLKHKLFGRNK